jgi:hypothetical protein
MIDHKDISYYLTMPESYSDFDDALAYGTNTIIVLAIRNVRKSITIGIRINTI